VNGWSAVRDIRQNVARELDLHGAGPDDRLMSIDAASFRYWTGRGGVVTPDDPLDTIREVAPAYDIRWLILERRDIVRAMVPILRGGPRPAWIGAPVFQRDAATTDPTLAGTPAIALYPVCFAPSDTRCAS